MRILATGGAGFIGSRVVKHLLVRGQQVAIVDDLSSGKLENIAEGASFCKTESSGGCADVAGDFRPEMLSRQAAQVRRAYLRRATGVPGYGASPALPGLALRRF